MKKIFTLFMATVVAVSMMALPQQMVKAEKASAPASLQNKELKAQEQLKKTDRVAMIKRVAAPQKAEVAPANPTAPKKVAKTAENAIVLTFNEFSVIPEYYPETGDWYMAASDDEYIVKFDYFAPEDDYTGTFTTEDFDLGYSYMYDPFGYYVDYESINMTVVKEKKGQYLEVVTLHAVIEGSDGNTYDVTVNHEFYTPKSEVTTEITGATMDVLSTSFVLTGKNDAMDLKLTVNNYYPAAEFSKAYFDMENTKIVYNGVEQTLLTANIVTEIVKNEDASLAWVSELTFYNQDTILHTVHVNAPFAPVASTVESEMLNLVVDDSYAAYYGVVFIEASNPDFTVSAGYYGYELAAGSYGIEDSYLTLTNQKTFEYVDLLYFELNLAESEDSQSGWVCDIYGRDVNNVEYKIHMKFFVPEPTQVVKVTFDKTAMAAFYPESGNDLQLKNENAEYEVALDVIGVPFGSTFTLEDMDAMYSWVYDIAAEEYAQIGKVEGLIDQRGDTTIMVASVICFNAVQYDVELWYAVPTPTETKELVIEDATFVNNLATYGQYQLYGYNADSTYLAAFAVNSDEIAGTFGNDGLFGKFGEEGGVYNFSYSSTYVIKYNDMETGDYELYNVEKGQLVVTVDENNKINAVASVICSDGVEYKVTMTSEINNHLEYDAEEGDVERTYTTADQIAITDGTADYGMIYFGAVAADNSDLMELYFFAETADADIVIPEGTYPINYTEEYGTVLANSGVQGNTVYPSYYAQLSEDGYLQIPLWFFVDGNVVVSKTTEGHLRLEVNAVNSYGVAIHVVYDGTPTAVENINVDVEGVQKQIIDGQLYIIRDGKAFNAMGAQVK